jgi:hypothetical protein
MDVAKIDQDVAHVASVSEICCKHLFKMFQMYIANVPSGHWKCFSGYTNILQTSTCTQTFTRHLENGLEGG